MNYQRIRRTHSPQNDTHKSAQQKQKDPPERASHTELYNSEALSDDLSPARIIQLQTAVGNQRVNQMFQQHSAAESGQTAGGFIQDKLNQSASPTVIQRLNTNENYYYQTAQDKEDNATVQEMKSLPAWSGLLGAVRIYDLFTTANLFRRSDVADLQGRLDTILKHAHTLDAFAFKKRRELPASILNMTETALDDVKQEREAIIFLQNDPGTPDGVVKWKQALFFARAGMSPSAALDESNLAPGVDGAEPGNPQALTGGNVSEVTALTYAGNDRRVFKPNETTTAGADQVNADFKNIQSAYRIMASGRIQALIKAKMEEAGRVFTSLLGNINFAVYKGDVGTATEFASGTDSTKTKIENGQMSQTYLNVDIHDVELQRQLANLQLFDIITGQGDRNLGNIMVEQKTGAATKVTGIDQDFAFAQDTDTSKNIGLTSMPQFIDRYFAEAVLAIQDGEILAAMKGLHTSAMEATMERFHQVKVVLRQLDASGAIIVAPGDPNHPNDRTWGDIDISNYRDSTFGFKPKDYAGQLRGNVDEAYKYAKQDPNLQPEQRDGKWILEYMPGMKFLAAREDDGSDLFDLVERAREEAEQDRIRAAWSKAPRKKNRAGFTLGHT